MTAVTYEVDVEAESLSAATTKACRTSAPDDAKEDSGVEANVLTQLGEPWVYGWSGDDPNNSYFRRPDQYSDRSNLLVFSSAYGHRFSNEDVALLRSRVESCVGPVAEHWNGAGTSTLSIRVHQPFGKLTDEQVAAIMGPR